MVKAQFPIGKTQWAKWRPEQQIAFNETRAAGVSFADAVKYVNELELVEVNIAPQPEPKKKKSVFDIIEDVAEIAGDIAEVGAMVSPVANVIRATTKGKKKGK